MAVEPDPGDSNGTSEVLGCSIRGQKSVRAGVPCQDDNEQRSLGGRRYVVAAADGLGSAGLSHVGSKVATQAVVRRIENTVTGTEPLDEESLRSVLRDAFVYARKKLQEMADSRDVAVSELNTTLLVAVGGPAGVGGAAVGDGGVIWHRGGRTGLLVPREDTEYGNQTIPVQSESWENSYRFGWAPDADATAVFSDGLDTVAWDGQASVSDELFDQVFDSFREFSDLDRLEEFLEEFLDGERLREASEDDKTLAVGALPTSEWSDPASTDPYETPPLDRHEESTTNTDANTNTSTGLSSIREVDSDHTQTSRHGSTDQRSRGVALDEQYGDDRTIQLAAVTGVAVLIGIVALAVVLVVGPLSGGDPGGASEPSMPNDDRSTTDGDESSSGTGGDGGDVPLPGTGGEGGDESSSGTGGEGGDESSSGTGGEGGDESSSGTGGEGGDESSSGTGGDESSSGTGGEGGDESSSGTGGEGGDESSSGTGGEGGDESSSGTGGEGGDESSSGTGGEGGDESSSGTGGEGGDESSSGTGGEGGDESSSGTGGDESSSGTGGEGGDESSSGTGGEGGDESSSGTGGEGGDESSSGTGGDESSSGTGGEGGDESSSGTGGEGGDESSSGTGGEGGDESSSGTGGEGGDESSSGTGGEGGDESSSGTGGEGGDESSSGTGGEGGDESSSGTGGDESSPFDVSIQSVEDVVAGKDITVAVMVENTGNTEQTGTIEAEVLGSESTEVPLAVENTAWRSVTHTTELGTNSIEVTLGAGNTTSKTLPVRTDTGDAGEYTVIVETATDTARTSVTVSESEQSKSQKGGE